MRHRIQIFCELEEGNAPPATWRDIIAHFIGRPGMESVPFRRRPAIDKISGNKVLRHPRLSLTRSLFSEALTMKTTALPRLLASSILLTSIIVSGVFGQDGTSFARTGAVEFGGTVSFQSTSAVSNGMTGDAVTAFMLEPYIGYFVGDGFELGFNPFGYTTISYGGSRATEVMILVAPSYNFHETGSVYPFIEGLFGYTAVMQGDNTADGFTWGGRAGVKNELAPHLLLSVSMKYLSVTTNPEGAQKRYGYNEFLFTAGLTAWF
jgi:hypothetical protein